MWTLQSADPAVLRLGHRNITSYFTVTGTTLYMTSHKGKCSVLNICVLAMILKPKSRKQRNYLTLSLPRVINSNVLFQSLTRDISYSNSPFESWLRWKLIEQSFLTTSLKHFLFEWLGEFALWAWDWKGQDLHDKGFPRKKRGCWKNKMVLKHLSITHTHTRKKDTLQNLLLQQTSITSKPMFSPSLSQSVHTIRAWQPRTSFSRVLWGQSNGTSELIDIINKENWFTEKECTVIIIIYYNHNYRN